MAYYSERKVVDINETNLDYVVESNFSGPIRIEDALKETDLKYILFGHC